jgi:hypothetical protein
MALRRSGSPTAFWDGTTAFNQSTNPQGGTGVTAAGTSRAAFLPRDGESLALFIAVNGATTITLEAAHHGANTAEGNEPSWIRLRSSQGPLTITAGYEIVGD